jgi:hypothetical protein
MGIPWFSSTPVGFGLVRDATRACVLAMMVERWEMRNSSSTDEKMRRDVEKGKTQLRKAASGTVENASGAG